MSKVTDWYPASVKPVRVGVYEIQDGTSDIFGPVYSYWNGSRFGYRSSLPERAFLMRKEETMALPVIRWRGLKEPALPDNREVSDGS
ncbi:hypothetical protein [Burkholderia glumae]|uniref:hypothetical protein n=1 Tax=Burkholderia glumae TaxID=337 RepID=UPI002151B7C4|nr:hypothetical protein [Burkholderia glumae]